MPKQKLVSEQLRSAIEQSGLTRYGISKETGISQGILSRFMNDQEAGLSLSNVDKLCVMLGAKLVVDAKPAASSKRKR